jgi:hypothetical protein
LALLGGDGTVRGATARDRRDASLRPAAFTATTPKRYCTPLRSPITRQDSRPEVSHRAAPGVAFTMYRSIGAPPSLFGALHDTATRRSPGETRTSEGREGVRRGTTRSLSEEGALHPASFLADAENRYRRPLTKPPTEHASRPLDTHDAPPGEATTRYLVMVAPPVVTGAAHRTLAAPSRGWPRTSVGAPGVVSGTTGPTGTETGPSPAEFDATTATEYALPLLSPVIVHAVAPEVVHAAAPGSAVAVYPLIGSPPSSSGGAQLTSIAVSVGSALTSRGTPGTVTETPVAEVIAHGATTCWCTSTEAAEGDGVNASARQTAIPWRRHRPIRIISRSTRSRRGSP